MTYKDGSRLRGGGAYRQSISFKEHIRRRDNYTCQVCGKPGNQVDHIIPYKSKPETTPEGVRILCQACNLASRHWVRGKPLPLDEWWAWIAGEAEKAEVVKMAVIARRMGGVGGMA